MIEEDKLELDFYVTAACEIEQAIKKDNFEPVIIQFNNYYSFPRTLILNAIAEKNFVLEQITNVCLEEANNLEIKMFYSGHGLISGMALGKTSADLLNFHQIMDCITKNTEDHVKVSVIMRIDCCFSGCFPIAAQKYIQSNKQNPNLVKLVVESICQENITATWEEGRNIPSLMREYKLGLKSAEE